MSVDIVFSTGERFFLCSTGAWQQVCEYASTPKLRELCEAGVLTGTEALADELRSVMPAREVAGTLASLAEKIGLGDPDESITVDT